MVNYSSRLGKHLYYETVDETNEVFCDFCKVKYSSQSERYAPCQKVEVLALTTNNYKQKSLINLASNISTLWLMEPFVNQLEIGDVVNLTAYYFMCP